MAVTLVAVSESRPLRRVWQLLQPLLASVTACMSWAFKLIWQALRCCTVLLRQWLRSWASTLVPSQSRTRKAWEEEIAEVSAHSKGQQGKGNSRAKHQLKGKAAPTKHQEPKHDTQPQADPSDDEETSARQEATAQKRKSRVSTDAHVTASEAAATVMSDKASANTPVQASEPVSKQATADKDSADTHKQRRRQPRTKTAAKPATNSQMPKQAASPNASEEVTSADHSSKKVLPPAGSIAKEAVTAAPVPSGKPQAAQSVPQLQTPSPQLQQPAPGASQAPASLKPSSADAPSLTPSDPSTTPLPPAPSQLQSALSVSPPSTPKASSLASDPLAFLLGQTPFSPSGNHANQPITKPRATITTSNAPNVTQAAV